jgi:hypothetical protein
MQSVLLPSRGNTSFGTAKRCCWGCEQPRRSHAVASKSLSSKSMNDLHATISEQANVSIPGSRERRRSIGHAIPCIDVVAQKMF